jgi:hypothetical protein
MASSALMFFTNDGIHFQRRVGDRWRTYSEGPASPFSVPIDTGSSTTDMIEAYTKRTLTWSTDILRAFSGILHAKHGERTSFGIPWNDFDRVFHWMPVKYTYKRRDTFPSWSWTSVVGRITFCAPGHIYSLAHWGRPAGDAPKASTTARWIPIKESIPILDSSNSSRYASHEQVVAALAWLNGCIRTRVPQSLRVDCSQDEYRKRLYHRWTKNISFRQEAFENYAEERVGESLPAGLYRGTGQIVVDAQTAFFNLDFDYIHPDHPDYSYLEPGQTPVIIRMSNNRIAGSISLDEHAAQTLSLMNQRQGRFIALSVSCGPGFSAVMKNSMMLWHVRRPSQQTPPSMFYGCPCSLKDPVLLAPQTPSLYREIWSHVVECPWHVDFYRRHSQALDRNSRVHLDELRKRALLHHLADVSYSDIDGSLLHDEYQIPTLNVMLVVPNTEGNGGHTTYQRLGIGQIYLKRWVEASPNFETLVLE